MLAAVAVFGGVQLGHGLGPRAIYDFKGPRTLDQKKITVVYDLSLKFIPKTLILLQFILFNWKFSSTMVKYWMSFYPKISFWCILDLLNWFFFDHGEVLNEFLPKNSWFCCFSVLLNDKIFFILVHFSAIKMKNFLQPWWNTPVKLCE